MIQQFFEDTRTIGLFYFFLSFSSQTKKPLCKSSNTYLWWTPKRDKTREIN